MPKFRKKPIIVEAEQFIIGKHVPDGVETKTVFIKREDTLARNGIATQVYFIRTLEGEMEVSNKDWVITGIKGEKYSCKPDIFEKLYESVDEELWQRKSAE